MTIYKAERIGKKYQWIGFRETQGKLADNFRYSDYDGEKIYDGPWQLGFERDIDPTLPISETHGEHNHDQSKTWWAPLSMIDWANGKSTKDWIAVDSSIPDARKFLEVSDVEGIEWIDLLSYNAWSELPPGSPDRYSIPFREIW